MTVGLGVSIGLMWHAHSVLAFYVGRLLVITFLVLALCRRASWTILDPRTAWPALTVFVYASVLHSIHTSGFDRTSPCLDVPDFPAVCAATVHAGVNVVDVQMPTLAAVAHHLVTLGRR